VCKAIIKIGLFERYSQTFKLYFFNFETLNPSKNPSNNLIENGFKDFSGVRPAHN
jgi:hypothetical protein